ncbi:iron-sulfur cluster carrier protein [Planctomycetota bacterium]|jgi:ATP-binding protein involved in chromosome partitioning|nr:Mrp/NBP35 family ATP-binding protein [Planctomycetota bacterium]MSR38747.1 iron-sulfur cluster carrier protein ApbC [Planctomycetota bacterium]GDY01473.1 iron-sulfur cluster carrier protein [Planctomycetota bacterium]
MFTKASAAPTEAEILQALRAVRDPDLQKDIVALGFIKDLRICGANVTFQIELTTPACPVKELMKSQAERAVMAVPGVTQVTVEMTARVTSSRPVLGEKGLIPGVKNVIAVSSGKGGVGKSTVAVNLACALARTGANVGILDADVYGPNVPLMLGVRGQPLVQNKKIMPLTAHGLQVMSMALLVADDQPVIWRGPMLHSAVRQFLYDVAWENLDYLVVDLPPGTGDAQLSLAQQAHIMGTVIVTTPQDVSVLDVKKAIRMFQTVNVPILGLVENMAWFTPPGSTERYHLFGSGGGKKIEAEFGTPILGQVPIEIAVREGGDNGKPIVLSNPDSASGRAFIEIAGKVAQRISILNAE